MDGLSQWHSSEKITARLDCVADRNFQTPARGRRGPPHQQMGSPRPTAGLRRRSSFRLLFAPGDAAGGGTITSRSHGVATLQVFARDLTKSLRLLNLFICLRGMHPSCFDHTRYRTVRRPPRTLSGSDTTTLVLIRQQTPESTRPGNPPRTCASRRPTTGSATALGSAQARRPCSRET
jgi:hypothetical protein